jgi:hypothetical protein
MSTGVGTRAPLELAERAHSSVQADPRAAARAAEDALRLAKAERDVEAQAAALHALGFAQHELGDAGAIRTLRSAVRVAERGGCQARAAKVRRTLAGLLQHAGRLQAARREIEAACASSTGLDRARAETIRLAVVGSSGSVPSALAATRDALRVLKRHGDVIWEARLLHNRGFLLAEAGEYAAAAVELEQARARYADLDARLGVAVTEILLARLRVLAGDVVGALESLDAVDDEELAPQARARLELSRAEALVGARLLSEAHPPLHRALAIWDGAAGDDAAAKGRLEAARLTLLAGDPIGARDQARTLARSLAARGQAVYAARATELKLAAEVAAGDVRAGSLTSARRAAEVLATGGWRTDALRLRLLIARAALELGSMRVARREFARAAPLRYGTVADRVELWHAQALLRLATGEPNAATRALANGLRLLDDYRAALGAIELRVTASEIGVELAARGLRLAIADGDPAKVLLWAERLRGNALRLPLVRPPNDPDLRALQNELRQVAAKARTSEVSGKPIRGLMSRQAELEAAIRARTRHTRGDGVATATLPRAREVARLLEDRSLIEYVEDDGELYAITVAGNRVRLHELGRADAPSEELEWLRFAIRRLGRTGLRDPQRDAALANARAVAAKLDRLLIEPLRETLRDGALVVVPTGALHALPWSSLPSLRTRPLVVAPSTAMWTDLARRPSPPNGKTVLVAGPRLRHARVEVRDLTAVHPRAHVLDGASATTEATLEAIDGAALAHFACHGRFRADSPLFSSLELADGPLTGVELQSLRRAPDRLVLSACDLALSDRHPGDELLGVAAALLAMGTRTVVASTVRVSDAAARRLMIAFHRQLAAGVEPAEALARAHDSLPPAVADFSGFVCLGSG